jgi:hypothetical protein
MSDDLEPPDPRDAGDADVASDDAAEIEALAAAGLGLVMPAPAASPGRTWADVEARARRSTRRRAWTGAVAAAVVLVLAVGAGALLARAGEEAETPAGPPGGHLYVLPPEGAEILNVSPDLYPGADLGGPGIRATGITFRIGGGPQLRLTTFPRTPPNAEIPPPTSASFAPSEDAADFIARIGFPAGWPAVDLHHPELHPLVLTCTGTPRISAGEPVPSYPLGAVTPLGGEAFALLVPEAVTSASTCAANPDESAYLVAAAEDLRVVDAEEWREFMDSSVPGSDSSNTTVSPTILSSSTTIDPPVTVRFPDEDDARAQITEAIKNWAVRDDEDGTYHHIEDGDDPELWAPRLAEAGRIAGSQAQEGEGSTIDVTSIRFASEDHAWVTFRLVTDLAGGHVDMQLPLEVRRIDGTWLVTRESLLQLLDRARMAPGATMPSTTTTVSR